MMIKRFATAVPLVVAAVSLAPAAHALPYTGPYCDPRRSDYYWQMCMDEPQNDDQCSEFGDMQQCQSDYRDFMRQQHQLTPTPN
jgi:hypothetical protein